MSSIPAVGAGLGASNSTDPAAAAAAAAAQAAMQAALAAQKYDTTLGSLLIGGLLALALWGITCVQTFNYFSRGSNDQPRFRVLIGILWCFDTFDAALNAHVLYYYMVTHYAKPLAVIGAPAWSIIVHVLMTSIIDFIIRSLFCRRVYRLSGNWILTGWIIAISLLDFIAGIVITAQAFQIKSFLELNKLSTMFYINFAAGTVSDASVAFALCYYLYKSRTGFTRTDSLIRVLMLYIINTGLVVALDATLGMVMYIAMPDNFIFLAFYLLLSKLYLNSYLASLNAREGLREKADETPVSIHLSRITANSHMRYDPERTTAVAEKRLSNDRGVAISVETMIDRKVDTEPSF
ncbi:hypothetical protein HGRIS_014514 [Hohenbuehelia grisea]|uniref:DUF6534 domain-containing protein n=1 Tax=Hohenbuehelia grisea TaxID=104357 RepID=A0ABR3JUJ5_9AGAR